MKTYKGLVTKIGLNQIFVFGSNTQGRHGGGAALWARQHAGAVYGVPKGVQGHSYGIITKDLTKTVHPSVRTSYIISQIEDLYALAQQTIRELEYVVSYSGTGINRNAYTPEEMAKMFYMASYDAGIPPNMIFEEQFAKLIESHTKTINYDDPREST